MPCLYRHIRLDKNEPFYIGISTNNKRAYDKVSRNKIWKDITSKTDYEVEIIYEHEDIYHIKQKEEEFIKLYGRINLNNGVLCNLTDGGENNSGRIVTDEMKKYLSEINKGEKSVWYGKKHSQETKDKISIGNKGKIVSQETRKKLSLINKNKTYKKGFKLSEETKMKISLSKKGKDGTPCSNSHKKILSQSKKEYWKINKEKHIGNNNVSKRKDVREKLSLASSGNKNGMYGRVEDANPFYRKKHSKESIDKISKNRKGKCSGDSNPSKREEVKEKIRLSKIKYWQNKKNKNHE
jgi:hypothetical protein